MVIACTSQADSNAVSLFHNSPTPPDPDDRPRITREALRIDLYAA
jgi:hypothetical protein